jgi:hypothetical protein
MKEFSQSESKPQRSNDRGDRVLSHENLGSLAHVDIFFIGLIPAVFENYFNRAPFQKVFVRLAGV